MARVFPHTIRWKMCAHWLNVFGNVEIEDLFKMEKLELKAPTAPKTLAEKIKDAVSFIKRAEKLAMKMQPDHGFWLSFSGGKDSVVILELAKMAGVKFSAYYSVTTIDPPELVRFIIEEHPEVKRILPKKIFLL